MTIKIIGIPHILSLTAGPAGGISNEDYEDLDKRFVGKEFSTEKITYKLGANGGQKANLPAYQFEAPDFYEVGNHTWVIEANNSVTEV